MTTNETRPACEQPYEHWRQAVDNGRTTDPWVYDALLDAPANPTARRNAADMCGPCPIRDNCLTKPYDKDWAEAAHSIVLELTKRARRAAA